MPTSGPRPTCIAVKRTQYAVDSGCSATRAPHRKIRNSGRHSPSFKPLSTLMLWRIRIGTNLFVTTTWAKAASVGATIVANTAACQKPSSWNNNQAIRVPKAMLSGSPIVSNRTGRSCSLYSSFRSVRDASVNSTMTKVSSASKYITLFAN